MGGWNAFLGLRIFFSQDFSPKNKKCSEWPEMQKKPIKFFSLLNNFSPRPVRKATARAWSIWILPARAVHFPARADSPRPGPPLVYSTGECKLYCFVVRAAKFSQKVRFYPKCLNLVPFVAVFSIY